MKPDQALAPLLVVDDDDNDATLLTRRLKDAGVTSPILHFRTGADAFLYLKDYCEGRKGAGARPVVMFLDVNMPDLSGFDVLLWARQQPPLRGMKIIMLSGATEQWDAQIAEKLGADEYLPKFPQPETLHALIRRLLSPPADAAGGGRRSRSRAGSDLSADQPSDASNPSAASAMPDPVKQRTVS